MKAMFNEKKFNQLCTYTQNDLLKALPIELNELGCTDVVSTNKYILSHGNVPVMVVAHMDTVHKQPVQTINYETIEEKDESLTIISSPQGIGGDDRCGLYMTLELVKILGKQGIKPYVLFTTDEEIGGIGVAKFCKDYPVNELDIKFLIEFDRAGAEDIVFYDCANEDWKKYVANQTGYKEAMGSYTDICDIMLQWGVCGVNVSCGYYSAHTLKEYVVVEDMLNSIDVVANWLVNETFEQEFEYIEMVYSNSSWGNYYYYGDDDLDSLECTGYLTCADCGDLITESIYQTSIDKGFGIALCNDCQLYYEEKFFDEFEDDDDYRI